ncbi:dihydropteroate synthase [Polyangium aurulentum]|nr:dihydropteroate synthase [Polyangium aurulentum]
MGVCNRTPDSFSDGGLFLDETAAEAHVRTLLAEGADIIDIGAESTRPGSSPVAEDEQITRIGPLVRASVAMGALVSIDTTSPVVAEHALREGARIVNTVSLEPAAELGALASRFGAALVLMHSRGSMSDMRGYSVYDDNAYDDIVDDVAREWRSAADRALEAGLSRDELVLDPGLGFAKNARHSIELCARLDELCALGFPVLVGASRKSFVARAASAGKDAPLAPPAERLGGTIAATLACVARGAAIVRVHEVAPVKQALGVMAAITAVAARRS